jgi:predicted O-methyltransferase YrrM
MPLAGYMKIAGRYAFAAGFLNENDKVLEAPCGFGYGAAYFANKCRKVEALDIAEENIRFAKEAFRHDNVNWNKEMLWNFHLAIMI